MADSNRCHGQCPVSENREYLEKQCHSRLIKLDNLSQNLKVLQSSLRDS